MKKRGRKLDEKKEATVVALRGVGWSFAEIGRMLEVSRQRAHFVYWRARNARASMPVSGKVG